MFFHGKVLKDGTFQRSSVEVERIEYVRNLAEHLGIPVPADEVFKVTDYPYIALAGPIPKPPVNTGYSSRYSSRETAWKSSIPCPFKRFSQGVTPNPRHVDTLDDEPPIYPVRPDRFSISETINMGTGIIAAGGAVVSATAAVQGMRHLRRQSQGVQNSDPEQGQMLDSLEPSPETNRRLQFAEPPEIHGSAFRESYEETRIRSWLARGLLTFERLTGKSEALSSPSIERDQLPAMPSNDPISRFWKATWDSLSEAARMRIEATQAAEVSSRSGDGTQINEELGLPDVPISSPKSTTKTEIVNSVTSDIKDPSNSSLRPARQSDHITFPSVPDTEPASTTIAERLLSPLSQNEEEIDDVAHHQSTLKRKCSGDLAITA
ncbi:MAG: hypothetical protein M1812_004544 [Candelaria pacifica]|nr:MAG: hypothetical protein M1812_004544 [Candelaria pacifica]